MPPSEAESVSLVLTRQKFPSGVRGPLISLPSSMANRRIDDARLRLLLLPETSENVVLAHVVVVGVVVTHAFATVQNETATTAKEEIFIVSGVN